MLAYKPPHQWLWLSLELLSICEATVFQSWLQKMLLAESRASLRDKARNFPAL